MAEENTVRGVAQAQWTQQRRCARVGGRDGDAGVGSLSLGDVGGFCAHCSVRSESRRHLRQREQAKASYERSETRRARQCCVVTSVGLREGSRGDGRRWRCLRCGQGDGDVRHNRLRQEATGHPEGHQLGKMLPALFLVDPLLRLMTRFPGELDTTRTDSLGSRLGI